MICFEISKKLGIGDKKPLTKDTRVLLNSSRGELNIDKNLQKRNLLETKDVSDKIDVELFVRRTRQDGENR